MDNVKIGKFLMNLRKEKNLTQEQLGEQLGVTNKTVSRWENGNYMPPIEMLQLLSDLFSVSINEILCGERLNNDTYKKIAEGNLKNIIDDSQKHVKKSKKTMLWTIGMACLVILLLGIGFACSLFFLLPYVMPKEKDIKIGDAVNIVKNDFGCEKVLWASINGVWVCKDPEEIDESLIGMAFHYKYYMVCEKNGEEVVVIVPSPPNDSKKPFAVAWRLDCSFKEVVEEINRYGAGYVADLTYSQETYDHQIDVFGEPEKIKAMCDGFSDVTGCSGEQLYSKLDIPVLFYYQWVIDDYVHYCCIWQENGELKSAHKAKENVAEFVS